jgi:hypothetical protein
VERLTATVKALSLPQLLRRGGEDEGGEEEEEERLHDWLHWIDAGQECEGATCAMLTMLDK